MYCNYSIATCHNVPKPTPSIGHNSGHNCLNYFSFVNDKINSKINPRKITLNHFSIISFSFPKKLQIPELINSRPKNYFKTINLINSGMKSTIFSCLKKSMSNFKNLKSKNNFFNKLILFSEIL